MWLSLLVVLFTLVSFVAIFTTKAFAAPTESYVANVVIFSLAGEDSSASSGSASLIDNLGHAFILVENKSGSDLTVGKMTIKPNSSVTLGTWGEQKRA